MQQSTLNIGLLGCGRIGQVHARGIAQIDSAAVFAVSDAVEAAANALAVTTDAQVMTPEEMLTNAQVHAVVIGTPTTTHYDLIHLAAKNGKAIFCEKPIDLSAERIRDCLAVVKQHNVPFFVGFNRRFDPNFAHLVKQVRDGAVGDIELVSIISKDPAPPPVSYIDASGGLFRDMMIHDLDMARFVLNEEPIEVHAMGTSLVDPDIGKAGDVDTAMVMLKTATGKLCQISNSRRASFGYDQRIEVHGSKGMIRAENVYENTIELATESGFTKAPVQHFFLERYEAAYKAELQQFVSTVLDGIAPNPSGDDGLKAQLLADAATEACFGAGVVKLS